MGSWLRIQKAAEYADVSQRTIRRWFEDGLKHSRVRGVPYTSREWIDDFIASHSDDRMDRMIDDMVRDSR
jgi:hypothetical protein